MRINKYDCFVSALGLYMFTNITYRLFPQAISPNRIIGILIFLSILLMYMTSLRKSDVFLGIYLISVATVSCLTTNDVSRFLEHIQYYIITVLILWKLKNKKFRDALCKSLLRKKRFLLVMIYLCVLSIIIAFFDPRSFSYGFTGFAQGAHPFISGITLIFCMYAFITYTETINVKQLLCYMVLIVAVCLGAARSYLLSIALLTLILYFVKVKKIQWKVIVAFIIIFAIVIFLPETPIFSRFSSSVNQGMYSGQDAIGAITSGRTVFWKLDLRAFADLPRYKQLFGAGFDYIYTYNLNYYGVEIWAHNDFIHLLVSIGIIGVAGYICILLALFYNLFLDIRRGYGKIKHPIIYAVIYIVGLACINGFYTYQHYVYGAF